MLVVIKKSMGTIGLTLLCLLLVLTGCQSDSEKKVVKSSGKGTQKVTLVPKVSSQDYQSIRPSGKDNMRGYINYGVQNRVDVDELENGLMSMSKSVYSPDNYVFQSGQYLSETDINNMLYRKSKKTPQGLNPPLGKGKDVQTQAENSPKILDYVLEQDYLKKSGNNQYKLGGISIAVSLNQVYSDKVMDKAGKTYDVEKTLNVSQVKQEGKTYAQKILQRIRKVKGLSQVPVFMTLYMEAPPESLVPGYYYAKTNVSAGSSTIGSWDSVNSKYVLFPSDEATNHYKTDTQNFNKFKSDAESYFPNFIGVVGKGYYKNGDLSSLALDINIKFFDETEVVSFTNYIASIVKDKFPFSHDVPVQIDISSGNVQEAIIVRTSSMDEPFVHIIQH